VVEKFSVAESQISVIQSCAVLREKLTSLALLALVKAMFLLPVVHDPMPLLLVVDLLHNR
jgi:hypothetical protein